MIGLLVVAQLAVVANAPVVVSSCAPFEVTVAARAPGAAAPRLAFPTGAFQVLRVSATSRAESDPAGRPFAVTEASYLVAVRGAGKVTLPAIVATSGAQRAAAAPLAVEVRESSADPDDPQVLVRAQLDDGRGLVSADSVFVGQQVDYVLEVQLNEAARRRLRRNPTFFPPDMPAVLAYDVAPGGAVPRTGLHCFESLTYRRALFPLFPGRTVIPPATLTYALPVSTSFFSREESHELRTDSVQIVAVEPPLAGRPADYASAIGAVTATARVSTPTARMGDPVVLTVRLEGAGNVKLLPRPAMQVDWAAVAPGEERVEVDTARARVSGAKEFDWLLTPNRAGRQSIGAIRYPYFDPQRAAYGVTETPPITLDIAAASLASADTAVAARPAIRRTLRGERGPSLPERPAFWIALALAPLPATLRRARRLRRRSASGPSALRRLLVAGDARAPVLARELRRLYLDALRERIPALQPATARAPLARQLRRAGVTDPTADAAESMLDRLDSAAFSGAGTLDAGTAAEAARLARDVDAQAVRRRGHETRSLVIAAACVLGAGAALGALPTSARHRFDEGVRAWDAGNAALAQRQFARAAAVAPRAVDAWANMATAALAAGDSAHAAAGWQRALRLDPLDAEVRERLQLVQGGASVSARGYVAPLPVDALGAVAIAAWLLAWGALAIAPARRPAVLRPLAGGAVVVALVALAAALEQRDRLDPRGLGVLRSAQRLAEAPAPDAEGGRGALTGEVGLLGAREGPWVRITLDGARAGWVPAAAVLPLDDASSN